MRGRWHGRKGRSLPVELVQGLSPTEFQWQSQNRNTQQSELGQKIRRHQERRVPLHLFVRRQAKLGGTTQPFLYAGTLEFERWEGEKPISVWWRMEEAVPEGMWGELRVGEHPAIEPG